MPIKQKPIEYNYVKAESNFSEMEEGFDIGCIVDCGSEYDLLKLIYFLSSEQKMLLLLRYLGYDARESMELMNLDVNRYYSVFRAAKANIKIFHLFYK